MKYFVFIILLLFAWKLNYGQKSSHIIYNSNGKKTSYKKMLKALEKKDVILFGELHNDPIAHWLQFEMTADLYQQRKLVLGAEMLEADNQIELNDYLTGIITFHEFDSIARLWNNYKTDYAPLVDFAKENEIRFIATNIPRRYANRVYKRGFETLDSLSQKEKKWIAPLPIPFDSELPNYKKILTMMGDHGSPKLVMAQAIKDATMANFILKNHQEGSLFIHYNGAFHSNNYEGILWYLKRDRSDLDFGTISTVLQRNVHEFLKENRGLADFIICVDENMTRTY
ncbi:MAG: ChaN family lipoprotein [Bacteroidota bacterium]